MSKLRGSAVVRIAVGMAAVVVAAACSASPGATAAAGSTDGSTPVRVVATTTQTQDFVRVVGGDCVELYGVLKPGVDPHDYEPSPADLDAISRAEVVVKNGVGLERWFDDTIASAEPSAAIVDASTGIEIRHGGPGEAGADEADEGDPHIWHDPQNAKRMVATIEQALAAARPSCAATFAANEQAYTAQLDQLDRETTAQIATLPNKKLVTNHDAFGYFVDHYGLEFVGSIIPSFDTSAELSGAEVDHLVALIRAQGVKAIFSESSLPPKTADAIGREAGVRVVEGDDALYGDSLGPAGSDGATYLQMEAHNARVIVDNLR